ncbi:splicing factor 3a [Zalerion maritima]|uniref:Splicing factor 3a n=1 Tax=Zalerion maritima TaxID=339359 RepID=A0AAD5RXW0_9PEZI|nr:splicing factor 3a [Zalerion maritima]
MLLEEQRYIHEDLERLEQGIADRIGDEPKHIRDRLNRDHEIAQLLDQMQLQSQNLLAIYGDESGARAREISDLENPEGRDPFESFYSNLKDIRDHHARYPNEQAENSELRYKPRKHEAGGDGETPYLVDSIFSGEEAFGRFFDLHFCHEGYLNLPTIKRLSYLQYLDVFDNFSPGAGGLKRGDKLTDQYFQYVGSLCEYLEGFMRRTRPLENVERILLGFDEEFEKDWEKDVVEGWKIEDERTTSGGDVEMKTGGGDEIYCPDCEKGFKNQNVYKGHLTGRKHIRAAEQRKARLADAAQGGEEEQLSISDAPNGGSGPKVSATRLKEHAIAKRENRVKKLSKAMSTERSDTRVNVERKQGMTERERQQELENLLNLSGSSLAHQLGGKLRQPGQGNGMGNEDDGDSDDDEKVYNPLKLPLAWDGKPIPFWLWRLHGLGVEFPCEICGNFVYMGRRAFDKHFNEPRHIYGLKCLGISQTNLFRDITEIEQALKLWEKIQTDRKRTRVDDGSVVQMEDADGNVMPEKVYYDLQKQGLL